MQVPVPITISPYTAQDGISINDRLHTAKNLYIDDTGTLRKRPGMTLLVDLGTAQPVTGLYWWKTAGVLVAVSNRRVYAITYSNGTATATLIDNTGGGLSALNERAYFASHNANECLITSGGRGVVYNRTTQKALYFAAGDTAITNTNISHAIVDTAHYLTFGVGTDEMHVSTPVLVGENVSGASPSKWQGESNTASVKPDRLVAMGQAWGEVLALGTETAEVFKYTGAEFPFERYMSIEAGCCAAHTLQFYNGAWYWLDNNRRVVRLSDRNPAVISGPIGSAIAGLSISGAKADVLRVNGRAFYVISYPAASRSFALDLDKGEWQGEWSYRDWSTGLDYMWLGNCSAFADDWNLPLVGSRMDGKIYVMSDTAYSDGDATNRILCVAETGHLDYSSGGKMAGHKNSAGVTLRMKEGAGAVDLANAANPYSEPTLSLYYNDDSRGYGNPRTVSLGRLNDTSLKAVLRRTGGRPFQTRQWKLEFTDNSPLAIAAMHEDISW